jgi:hypothetical protein
MDTIQRRILHLIQAWNQALYEKSRYRSDMIHIHDMYLLLKAKGYQFPIMYKDEIYMIVPTILLHTEEELEIEDQEMQSAVSEQIYNISCSMKTTRTILYVIHLL